MFEKIFIPFICLVSFCACHPFGIQTTDTVTEAEEKIYQSFRPQPDEPKEKIDHERIG